MNKRMSQMLQEILELYCAEWIQRKDMNQLLQQFLQTHKEEENYAGNPQEFQNLLSAFEKLDPYLMVNFKQSMARFKEIEKVEAVFVSSPGGMHLSDLLSARRVYELKRIAEANGIILQTAKKKEMVQCLVENLPQVMDLRINWIDIIQVRWIQRAMKQSGILTVGRHPQQKTEVYQQCLETGFLFPVRYARAKALVVPIEFRDRYDEEQRAHQDEHAFFAQYLRDFTMRYLVVYGLMPLKLLCSELSIDVGTNITGNTLELCFGRGMKCSPDWETLTFHHDGMTYLTTLDKALRGKLLSLQNSFQYGWREYDEMELEDLMPDGYLIEQPGQDKLVDLLSKHVGQDAASKRIDDFIIKVQWGVSQQELSIAISELLISLPQRLRPRAEKSAMLLASHIPQWILKGHTSLEAAAIGPKDATLYT